MLSMSVLDDSQAAAAIDGESPDRRKEQQQREDDARVAGLEKYKARQEALRKQGANGGPAARVVDGIIEDMTKEVKALQKVATEQVFGEGAANGIDSSALGGLLLRQETPEVVNRLLSCGGQKKKLKNLQSDHWIYILALNPDELSFITARSFLRERGRTTTRTQQEDEEESRLVQEAGTSVAMTTLANAVGKSFGTVCRKQGRLPSKFWHDPSRIADLASNVPACRGRQRERDAREKRLKEVARALQRLVADPKSAAESEAPHEHQDRLAKLGSALVRAMVDGRSGMFELNLDAPESKKSRGRAMVSLAAGIDDELLRDLSHPECFAADNWAMVCRPQPWTRMNRKYRGGYLRNRVHLISGARHSRHSWELERPMGDGCLKALNLVQNTAWEVNADVLRVLETFLNDAGSEAWSVPERKYAEVMPKELRRPRLTFEQRTERRKYLEHAKLRRIRDAANSYLVGQPARARPIWMPHRVDYRGRFYPLSADLYPQGCDPMRALLRFHEPKVLGPQGVRWLAIHVANLGQQSNRLESLNARERWTHDNSDQIIEFAREPHVRSELWPFPLDKPWCFVAACMEWTAMVESNDRENFESRLPVTVDGTCNGFQHLAAVCRATDLAQLVNLTPTTSDDLPRDLYTEVADWIKARPGVQNPNLASRVSRDVVKQAIMTLPYSASKRTRRRQIADKLGKAPRGADQQGSDPGTLTKEQRESDERDAGRICDLIDEYMKSNHGVVMDAMQWLKAVVDAYTNRNMPLQWSPSGDLRLQQGRVAVKKRRIRLLKDSQKWSFTHQHAMSIQEQLDILAKKLGKRSNEIDRLQGLPDKSELLLSPRRQQNAVTANVVHSLDAAHLIQTINQAGVNSITSFYTNHDSYGTHAGVIPTLRDCLRSAFVEVHKNDLLASIKVAAGQDGIEVPDPPPLGEFDIKQVQLAKYLFS